MNWLAVRLGALIGLFGLVISRPQLLDFVAGLSTVNALFLWYALFAVFVVVVGFTMLPGAFNLRYLVALLLITWALGIVLYYPISGYSVGETGADITSVEGATEDAVTYDFLTKTLGIPDSTGILTYAVVPFILVVIAGTCIAPTMLTRIFSKSLGRGS